MWCVREHINRLHLGDLVACVEQLQVACLCGGVAADIYYALRVSVEYHVYNVGVHAGAWRVGDDDIGASVLGDEVVGKDVLHVTGIEQSVVDVVYLRVDLGILDGLRHILYADDFLRLLRHEVGYGACAGVEVIYEFVAGETSKLPCHAVQVVGLLGVGLVELLRSDLEFQVLHKQEDMVIALEQLDVLIANGVVALLVVKIHQ